MRKIDVIKGLLPESVQAGERGEAFAPSNIALCKYWGKRDRELNLPINASLSVSLAHLGSKTVITESETGEDRVVPERCRTGRKTASSPARWWSLSPCSVVT